MVGMRIAEFHPAGWHTTGVDRMRHPPALQRLSPRALARWVLLAAVIAGVFMLHVLTSENDHNDHGDPSMGLATGLVTPRGAAATDPDSAAAAAIVGAISDPATPIGDGMAAGCPAACCS